MFETLEMHFKHNLNETLENLLIIINLHKLNGSKVYIASTQKFHAEKTLLK